MQEETKKKLSINERLDEWGRKNGLNRYKIAKETGISEALLYNYYHKKTKVSTDSLEKILKKYKALSSDWLLTGRGSMLREDSVAILVDRGVPLVRQEAVGGIGGDAFSINERDIKGHYVIPDFEAMKPDFMIRVQGSSMYPKYSSGDVVACKIIKEKQFIQWNKTHVVATRGQGILIKRIREGKDESSLSMFSDNRDYESFLVPRSEITGIALVVGVIRLE